MSLSESTRTEIRNCLSILKVIAGVVHSPPFREMSPATTCTFTQLPDHPARGPHPFLCDLRTVGSLGREPLLRPQFPRTADFDTYLNIIDWSGAELPATGPC